MRTDARGVSSPPRVAPPFLRLSSLEAFLPPRREDRLGKEFGLFHRQFRLHPPRGVGHHVREDEGVEDLADRRARRARGPHGGAPLLRVLERVELPLLLPRERERIVAEP